MKLSKSSQEALKINERRLNQFIREWKGKTKRVGDFYWQKVHGITGEGDYISGYDDGEQIGQEYN